MYAMHARCNTSGFGPGFHSIIRRWVCASLPGSFSTLGFLTSLILMIGGCPSSIPDDGSDEDVADDGGIAREIEEADIIKLEEGFLYVANPFTGLRLIDVRRIDQPALAGVVPLGGRAVELFVRQERAYVLSAADFYQCAGASVGFAENTFSGLLQPDFEESRLWVVDVAVESSPAVLSTFDFDGFVTSTRRVGEVIYVAGNLRGSSIFGDVVAPITGVFVASIDISDPQSPTLVDAEQFTGSALDIHVSESAIYVLGRDPELDETTLVTYVDITDPGGDIAVRDQFRVPGLITNRFFADEHEGVFRIVTEEFIREVFTSAVALYTYDVSKPENVSRTARLPIITDESLRAVRFDGPRGYAVTFRQIDPLFVLDLSDPAAPTVAGELEVPGFSTHLVPLGERLLGVGFDDTAGSRPAVSLYDVSNPARPTQLSRVIVGERFTSGTTSEATVDERSLKVIEDAGLVLLPFSTFDFRTAQFVDSLQLIELGATRLREAGVVNHRGLVRRADLLQDRVWVLSDASFQVVTIADMDHPESVAAIDLISDQELLDAGLSECADSARFHGEEAFFFGSGFCGLLGIVPMFTMVLGLCALRNRRVVSAMNRGERRG